MQQLCRRPAQSQGHALRQGVGSLPLPAWNRHQHCCCRQGEALRQQLNEARKRFALAGLGRLQQQLAQIACVRPERTPRQGHRGTWCREPSAAAGCPKGHRRSGSGARSEGFGQSSGARDAQQVARCNERSTVGLNRSEIRRLLWASPAASPPRCGGRLRCR